MAEASSQLSEDQCLCPICLEVFVDPVTLPCGHNFCKKCLTQDWDVTGLCQCPACKHVFDRRPELRVVSETEDQCRVSPQKELDEKLCEKHDRPLEMFSDTDPYYMCHLCTGTDHKTHSSCSLKKQKNYATIQKMIQERRFKIEEIKESVKLSQEDAEIEAAASVQVFTALVQSVERGLAQLIDTIVEKQKATERQAEGFIKELEEEISELMKRSSEVEQLSHNEDHLHFLQSYSSSLNTAPPTKDWTEVRVHSSYEGTVRRAVAQLKETINKEVKKLTEDEVKRVQQFAVDVTLDPDTAHAALILSEDRKQVSCGDVKKCRPDNPKRFSSSPCVLGKQSFSSGRFYYEVEVKGKTKWDLGVASESINRKGPIAASPLAGLWIIWLKKGNEYKALDEPSIVLTLKSQPQKVGVFVDYEEGLVSFYDVDAAALIYSFTGCNFSEKLYPIFGPGLGDGQTNSAPLVICPLI
ncbi:E3 ubiquitin-protein ligase TRIM21-like [Mugil cephalus]|uniref:E3 ubiquitin-protein ligase TRIM21-like n=1 Tax=Mugil cephalus TaxID=48193 RepID=UPI001FB67862|nr:E3 ubiquitin-protein ligase TRIM21-like [Mugil cephalus]